MRGRVGWNEIQDGKMLSSVVSGEQARERLC